MKCPVTLQYCSTYCHIVIRCTPVPSEKALPCVPAIFHRHHNWFRIHKEWLAALVGSHALILPFIALPAIAVAFGMFAAQVPVQFAASPHFDKLATIVRHRSRAMLFARCFKLCWDAWQTVLHYAKLATDVNVGPKQFICYGHS